MNLVVLFTYGYKMSDWAKKGHLQREAILYNTLADNGVYTTFITYGDKEDFKWENQFNDKIKIIPVYDKLYYFRSKVLRFIQSFFIPFYLKEILKKSGLIKTNQIWGGWVAVIAKYLYNVPFIARCGNEPYSFSILKKTRKRQIFKHLLNGHLTYKCADKIIVATNAGKDVINNVFNISSNKINVLANWIDTELFKPMLNVGEYTNRIIAVGRLVKQKNYPLIFNTIKDSSFTLDIIGSGEMEDELRELAIKLKISVNFLGKVKNNQLPTIYNQYPIYVLTSIAEGNPKTLLEAMACECAVIGTNVAGINNIVRDGKNGILVDLDQVSLKKAILKLISDEQMRVVLGKQARKNVVAQCSFKTYITNEINTYKALL